MGKIIKNYIMESKILGNCFMCKKECLLTHHHVIPQRYNPNINITIGICKECHEYINKLESNEEKRINDLIGENQNLQKKLRLKSEELKGYMGVTNKIKSLMSSIK